MTYSIELLSVDDLPGCLALAEDRDWPPESHKWRLLLDIGTAYGVRDPDGELVGTTILTRYRPRDLPVPRDLSPTVSEVCSCSAPESCKPPTLSGLAAISMVLVAARCGGQGLGRALMTHALAATGDAVVVLNATVLGRPLYEKLGFAAVSTTQCYVGAFTGAASGLSRPAVPADLPAIGDLDAQTVGAGRGDLLERLPAFADQLRVIERGDELIGYGGAWRNFGNTVIGPVIARTEADAVALIADVAAGVVGPVRLDLDTAHPGLHAWAAKRGLSPGFASTVMVRGGSLPGCRSQWFVPLMQALG